MTDTEKDTPPPGNVVEAIRAVMEHVTVVRKDQVNTTPGQGGYKFRGIDAVVNALGPAMRQVGLVVMPRELLSSEQREVVVGQKSSRMTHSLVRVRYGLYGPGGAGDVLLGESVGEAFDSGDKSMAKAMSVSLRTFLLQTFMLPTDDPDPDEQSYELSPASDEDRQALPPSRPAQRSRGQQQPAEDPFAVVPLTEPAAQELAKALQYTDPEAVRAAYRRVTKSGWGNQTITADRLEEAAPGVAGVIGMASPGGSLPLWDVLGRIGKAVAEHGSSVTEQGAVWSAGPAGSVPDGDGDVTA